MAVVIVASSIMTSDMTAAVLMSLSYRCIAVEVVSFVYSRRYLKTFV